MTRNFAVSLIALLSVTLTANQLTESRLPRFGLGGESLADAEIAQITELVSSNGKVPWLLLGENCFVTGLACLTVYLEPNVSDSRVKRGQMLRLGASKPPVVPERSAWRVSDVLSYACIPAPGRQPGDVSHEYDIGWPFAVYGEFDDEILASIVEFIRSRPLVPDWGATVRIADAPIVSIARKGPDLIVVVNLRTGELVGEEVTLVKRDGKWVITRFGRWIV